jgi:hypothetical protein
MATVRKALYKSVPKIRMTLSLDEAVKVADALSFASMGHYEGPFAEIDKIVDQIIREVDR